jgi:hypothetical protein
VSKLERAKSCIAIILSGAKFATQRMKSATPGFQILVVWSAKQRTNPEMFESRAYASPFVAALSLDMAGC